MKGREKPRKKGLHGCKEDRNLLQDKSLKLEKIKNEKMSKRRIQITDLQKKEKEEKQERRLIMLEKARIGGIKYIIVGETKK